MIKYEWTVLDDILTADAQMLNKSRRVDRWWTLRPYAIANGYEGYSYWCRVCKRKIGHENLRFSKRSCQKVGEKQIRDLKEHAQWHADQASRGVNNNG